MIRLNVFSQVKQAWNSAGIMGLKDKSNGMTQHIIRMRVESMAPNMVRGMNNMQGFCTSCRCAVPPLMHNKMSGLTGIHCTLPHMETVWTSHQPRRYMWRMLNMVFNRPDRNRIKEVGVERACAEWLLRCGAHVRWMDSDKWFTDYNSLPSLSSTARIAEINADEAAVMDVGFAHLEGLTGVRSVRFYHCPYLENSAISQLSHIKDSLTHLEISSCGDISDEGLLSLASLQNLETLSLTDLPEVRDKKGTIGKLQQALPKCVIDFKDDK